MPSGCLAAVSVEDFEGRRHMRVRLIPAVSFLFAAVACTSRGAQAQCVPNATAVAEAFVRLDFEGARLHTRAGDPIWRLTMDDGITPNDSMAVTRAYRVVSATGDSSLCRVQLQFDVFGFVTGFSDGTFQFHRRASTEDQTITLRCKSGSCLIDLRDGLFGVLPHPGKVPAERWVAKLLTPPVPVGSMKALRRLRDQIAALPDGKAVPRPDSGSR